MKGHFDVSEILIKAQADIDLKDKVSIVYAREWGKEEERVNVWFLFIWILWQMRKTPLHYAAECGHKDIVTLIINNVSIRQELVIIVVIVATDW